MGTERRAPERAARLRERERAASAAGVAERRDVAVIRALQGAAGNAAVAARLARYTENGPDDNFSKLSNDHSLAVPMESNLGSRRLYGRPSASARTVDAANLLLAVRSPIQLSWDHGDTRDYTWSVPGRRVGRGRKRGRDVDHTERFSRIVPRHRTEGEGDAMTLLQDCGRNTREVIGGGDVRVQYASSAGPVRTFAAGYPLLAVADLLIDYLPRERAEIERLVRDWTDARGSDATHRALDRHLARLVRDLRPAARRRLERDAQINAYAVPAVGQGVVIVGGGPKNPDAARKWKFHMAPVVINSADGRDYVTLENFNTRVGGPRNTAWAFNMYGSLKRQTIHSQQTDVRDGRRQTGEFGDTPTTFVVG